MQLSKELMHRSTPKAKALLQKVEKSLIGDVSPPVAPPLPEPKSPAPESEISERVAIECGNCGESNFVSVIPDIIQYLSCAHCKTSYEALYKHGVMRSKFTEKPMKFSGSSTSPLVWVLLALFILAAIFVFK
nr:hypothetical protein [uncultured Comamonas sp.]